MLTALRRYVGVEEISKSFNLSTHQSYEFIKKLPAGIQVRLGRRVRVDAGRLADWLAKGGDLADRASA